MNDRDGGALRPLDEVHVQNLAESMRHVLKIAAAPDRVCITMSREQMEKALRYTAVMELFGFALGWYELRYQTQPTESWIDRRVGEIRAQMTGEVTPWIKRAFVNQTSNLQ